MASSLEIQEGDLIDLHVGSPVLPRLSTTLQIEATPESLLDSELPVLEEKLQTCDKSPEVSNSTYIDVEDILISIDDDEEHSEEEILSPSSSAMLLDLCQGEEVSLEALNVLMKLDEILNETLEKSDNHLEDSSLHYHETNEIDKQSIEDCLEDLDNYLKAFETGSSDDCTDALSKSDDVLEEIPETDVGHVNLAFEVSEDLRFTRTHPSRVTVAVGRRPDFDRNTTKRRSLGEIPISDAPVRISGPGAVSEEEVDLSWSQERRAHPPGDCCTGTVVVEPIHSSESERNESSWLRTSMRRIRHLRIPSTEAPSEIEITASDGSEMVTPRIEVTQCQSLNTVRPFSAPSRITTHSNAATQSSIRRSRAVSREPGGRARSSSASSRSRRPRSLSSSESSLASSIDTTPSCTPAPTPTRNNQESTTSSNGRRSCERSRQNDMPDAESPLGHWPHSLSSMLACLGCTVGLFNISRFAILTVHFGANFIFQFFILSIVIGLPLFTLQLCLGQQLGAGVIDMWRISPLFQGVGVALLASQAFIGLYSIMGVSWLFVYFRDSFITKTDRYRWAEPFFYYRDDMKPLENSTFKLSETVPDYFNGVVLQRHHLKSGNFSGTIKFQLAFNLAVVWMIVFVSLSKGLRSYGKVIYVFTILPIFGIFIVCAKILSLIPPDFVYIVFPETSWNEFFINSKSWIAASQEVFLTWGLLGAATMQIASHNKNKHLLQRDSSLIAVITFAILLLSAFLANTCVQILRSNGYIYLPSSFEKMGSYSFLRIANEPLPANLASLSVRYMPHQSFIVGERVTRPGADSTSESGYQALRLATELIPATFAVMGSDEISPFWAVLFYFILILFGIAQQLAIWHCIITGIMAIKAKVLKSWETTITFFSCACGFLLGLPMATEFGIYMVYFMDFTIGGMWWLILVILLEIVAVFMVRGRPYSGDALVNALFMSQTRPCLLTWAPALLSFTWNVILPVGLMVWCVTFFRNGNFRELFVWHHAPSLEYWPMWARQIGSMLQLLPVLCVPLVAVIQSYRYLNNGPPDILDRVQLLYRPPIGEHMEDLPVPESTVNNNTAVPATTPTEDPPPKYTPPPSYTTATGARIAKFLRQSIRRSVRRIANVLGEGSSRQRTAVQTNQTQLPPPDYNAVLVEMNQPQTSVNVINVQTEANQSTLGRELAAHARRNSGGLTIADVASILRNSFRRSRIRVANTLRRGNATSTESNNPSSLSAENLVDSAAPIGETSLVLDNLTSHDGEVKPISDNLSSVI